MKPKNTLKHNFFNMLFLFATVISGGISNTVAAAQISGFVWLDNNADGLQSEGEPGFARTIPDVGNLAVAAYPEGSTEAIAVTFLDETSKGHYAFENIPAGNYYVCANTVFDLLGLSVTKQDVNNDAIDSDFDATPCAYNVIMSNTRDATLDLGLVGGPLLSDPTTVKTNHLNDLTVKTGSLLINHQWRPASEVINANNPVIFYTAPTSNGGQRGVARMRYNNDQLEFKFQEWSNLDGIHTNEAIHLVSFPQGNWQDGSTQIEVGTATISDTKQWKTVHFASTFSTPPAVVLSLQTANGGDAVDVHVRNITKDSMQIALFEEEAKINSGHITETVGFLAITSNASPVDLGNAASTRLELPFQTTGIGINHRWKTIGNGDQIRLEEDQSKDQETAHAFERVHVVRIDGIYLTQIASAVGGDPSVLRSRSKAATNPVDPENPVDPPGSEIGNQVSGIVWLDKNADGLRNNGEPGFTQTVPDVGLLAVALYPEGSTQSIDVIFLDKDSNGRYRFENVPAGDYYICTNTVFDLIGLSVTTEDAGNDFIDSDFDIYPCSYDVSVSGGQMIKRDLGLVGEIPDPDDSVVQDGSWINGTVWIDANQNALIDDNENGVSAVVGIYALPEKVGSFVKHIVTDENGFYEFTNLATGEYKVVVNGTNVPTSVSDFNSNVTIDFPVDNISSGIIEVDGETCTLRNALILFIFDQIIGDCRLIHPSIAAKIVLKPGSDHVLGSLPRAVSSPGLGYPFVVGSVIRPPSGIVIYGNGARIDRVSSASPDSAAYLNSTVKLVNVSLDTVGCGSVIYRIDHANIGSVGSTHDAVSCSISHSNIGSTSGFGPSADGHRVSSSVISGFAGGIGWLSNTTIEDTFSPGPGFGGGSTIISSTINKIIGGHIGRIQNSVIGGVLIDEFTAQSPNALDGCLNDQRILDPQCLLDLNDAG